MKQEIIAFQFGYLKDSVKVVNNSKIIIKEIGMEYFDFIKANYSTEVEDDYLIKRILTNVFVDTFDNDKIVGFVEVIEQYRRQGLVQILETYLVDKLIKSDELLYLQVEVDNEPSIRLHEKLGYQYDIITRYM